MRKAELTSEYVAGSFLAGIPWSKVHQADVARGNVAVSLREGEQ